jgi:hypothetical protein
LDLRFVTIADGAEVTELEPAELRAITSTRNLNRTSTVREQIGARKGLENPALAQLCTERCAPLEKVWFIFLERRALPQVSSPSHTSSFFTGTLPTKTACSTTSITLAIGMPHSLRALSA